VRKTDSILSLAVLSLALVAAPGTTLAGTCSGSSKVMTASNEARPNIVTTAVEAGSFNTLVAAVKAAGLVEALQAEGPLTAS
jgi:uncharacterized surface protein with fasciclin (FAS1) repeats